MRWEIVESKKGPLTLKGNGYYIYSKYNPKLDAEKFIDSEMNPSMDAYLLFGLGLGYHLETLLNKTITQKIYVCVLDSYEKSLFEKYGKGDHLLNERVDLVKVEDLGRYSFDHATQALIPFQWVKALGHDHKFFAVLDELKTQQMSYRNSTTILDNNFIKNINNHDPSINDWRASADTKPACLVSAGPSLNQNINLLRKLSEKSYIISVGSALKVLLRESIEPDAVIITDPQTNVVQQIQGIKYRIPLFYLSTANHQMTLEHPSSRYIIFQKGYTKAEDYSKKIKAPLLDTGGSVATTALSLLEYMGYQDIYLFGQDLGFTEKTHAEGSTSGLNVLEGYNFRKVKANNGDIINTSSNLQVYQRWFEKKAKRTSMKIYNTASSGAKIEGIPFINEKDLLNKINFKKTST